MFFLVYIAPIVPIGDNDDDEDDDDDDDDDEHFYLFICLFFLLKVLCPIATPLYNFKEKQNTLLILKTCFDRHNSQ